MSNNDAKVKPLLSSPSFENVLDESSFAHMSKSRNKSIANATTPNVYTIQQNIFSLVENILLPKSEWSKYNCFFQRLRQKQMECHQDESMLFHYILGDDLTGLRAELEKSDSGMKDLDSYGKNIIQVAYLYQRYTIGRWLVQNFPHDALRTCPDMWDELRGEFIYPVSEVVRSLREEDMVFIPDEELRRLMPMTGQNILHTLLVLKNVREIRWLLDFYRDHEHSIEFGLSSLLTANATGSFYDPSGPYYLGGYPIHFATSSNDKDIFDVILTYASVTLDKEDFAHTEGNKKSHSSQKQVSTGGASCTSIRTSRSLVGKNALFVCDDNGNNVLHFCVTHQLQDMYKHIVDSAYERIQRELKAAFYSFKRRGDKPLAAYFEPVFSKDDSLHLPCYPPEESELNLPDTKNLDGEALNIWIRKEARKKLRERLLLVLNKDYHSPLTLAASRINMQKSLPKSLSDYMISFLELSIYSAPGDTETDNQIAFFEEQLDQYKEVRFSYGPIKVQLLDLEGIEYPYDTKNYLNREKIDTSKMHSTLGWLSINHSEKGLMVSSIAELIRSKWARVGQRIFIVRFYEHVILTCLVTLITCMAVESPTKHPVTAAQVLVNIFYIAIIIMLGFQLLHEVPLMYHYGVDYWGLYGGIKSVAVFEKYCKFVIVLSFFVLVGLKAKQSANGLSNNDDRIKPNIYFNNTEYAAIADDTYLGSNTLTVSIASAFTFCVISCWIYMYYFLMGFDSTAPVVMTIYQVVSKDMPYFARFYAILLLAFACPLSMLTNQGVIDAEYGILRFVYAMINLIQSTVNVPLSGLNDATDITLVPHRLVWIFELLFTLFFIIVVLVTLNLLIGMIGNTYGTYLSKTEGFVLIEKYNMMRSWERAFALNPTVMTAHRCKYAIKMKKEVGTTTEQSTFAFEFQEQQDSWWESTNTEDVNRSDVKKKVALLIIDPQNDFHPGGRGVSSEAAKKIFTRPESIKEEEWLFHENGSLAVAGANEDSERIAVMIAQHIDDITDIFVTLDSHHACHIAHAVYWVDQNGGHPEPFTVISPDDLKDGKWKPNELDKDLYNQKQVWARFYLNKLKLGNRFQHVIWPQHCIIGSEGHNIVPVLNEALKLWTSKTGRSVVFVMKGLNCQTEMYSALSAEVEDPEDTNTMLNEDLLAKFKIADKLIVCGEALSHCVRFTMEDITSNWTNDMSRIVLLTDGCSSVGGYHKHGEQFIAECEEKGVSLSTTETVFKEADLVKANGSGRHISQSNNDDGSSANA